jgi:hypothetical protein
LVLESAADGRVFALLVLVGWATGLHKAGKDVDPTSFTVP